MPLCDVDEKDRHVIKECLSAAAHGPFFPDSEFGTLFGLERREVAAISDAWPDLDETQNDVSVAISNAMNWLLFYPSKHRTSWDDYISVTPADVARVFAIWRGKPITGPVDGMM